MNKLGHIGYILILLGMFLLANASYWGWLFRIVGELIWTYVGLKLHMSSIWLWGFIFILFDTYGFIKWLGYL